MLHPIAHNRFNFINEVQTGFGRTGKMFGAENVDVEPDIVTLAKGIAGGFPLAAVLGRSHIMDSIHDAGIGSTFGASPVSCGQEGNVIRFMGPLTTPQNQVEEAMEIFKNSLV